MKIWFPDLLCASLGVADIMSKLLGFACYFANFHSTINRFPDCYLDTILAVLYLFCQTIAVDVLSRINKDYTGWVATQIYLELTPKGVKHVSSGIIM